MPPEQNGLHVGCTSVARQLHVPDVQLSILLAAHGTRRQQELRCWFQLNTHQVSAVPLSAPCCRQIYSRDDCRSEDK